MLFTISTTHKPATDLGFLLHKNPNRVHTTDDLAAGIAHVFYPEATEERCTAALLLDINPVTLVRGRENSTEGGGLAQYVNDRCYVASSYLSVAMRKTYSTALSGRCKEKPELAATPLPLEATLSAVECRGGEEVLRRLFEPLGYQVEVDRHVLDPSFPDWGDSRYYSLKLSGVKTVHDLLSHVYVLITVLDNDKHYLIGEAEVEKLLRHGEGWLTEHPEKNLIIYRYLRNRRSLTRQALEQLADPDDVDPDATDEKQAGEEEAVEKTISLNERRMQTVLDTLTESGAKRLIDLGCGEGKLIGRLHKDRTFSEVVGVDVSCRVLERAHDRLKVDRMSDRDKARLKLMQGSLVYKDSRFSGYDAATCIEVIEHLDPPRLAALERVLFEFARPPLVVLTTPNSEFNVRFESLPAGQMRHRDHRFEWTRSEFEQWAHGVCERHRYQVKFLPIGDVDPEVGAPTQMGVFTL